jgi:urease accessory protein
VGHAAADLARSFAANRAVGTVALAVRASGDRTRRWRLREEGSLRVRCPRPASAELEAIIVNTAGGVAGGDRLRLDVSLETGARLAVTTAAAEKVYRALEEPATIDVKLSVKAGARLAWLPQETILFDRARLRRTIDIDLAADARLLLAEAIVFGRGGMGEAVHEGGLFDRWRLRRDGRLMHAEAMRLDGGISAKLAQGAVAKGGTAVATVLVVPGDEATADSVRALDDQLRGEVGASAWNGLAVVRLCAVDGEALRHDLIAVLTALRRAALPRLWLN